MQTSSSAQTPTTTTIRVPHFPAAGQPDIIRSQQKDEYYLLVLSNYMKEVGQWLLGTRYVVKYEKEMETLSRLLYYSLQTLTNQPTLGEEYCDLVQVKFMSENKVIQSPYLNRLIMVFLNTGFPYLWEKLNHKWLTIPRRWVSLFINHNSSSSTSGTNSEELQFDLDHLIQFLTRFHLAVFYLAGTYLQISKRATSVRYVFTGTSEMQRPTYNILGTLIFVQQFVSFVQYVTQVIAIRRKRRQKVAADLPEKTATVFVQCESNDMHETSQEDDGQYRCSLCLERRKQTTATSCGHLFCWKCITECIVNNASGTGSSHAKCPICRQEIRLQTLTRVYHYDQPVV